MRVTQVVRFDAGLYYGGGEIQADLTRKALVEKGVEARFFSPTDRDLGDIVHFFGNFDYFEEIAVHCRSRGVPYVVSPIFATPRSASRLRWRATRTRALGGFRKDAYRMLRGASKLFTLSERESELLTSYFGSDLPPMIRVPNGVESRFHRASPAWPGPGDAPRGPFVLMVGGIQKGKNQLAAIDACGSDFSLVVAGAEIDTKYASLCRARATERVQFLGPVNHHGDLEGLLAMAHVFVLPSQHELFPLSALEAAAAGCHLVISNTWGAQDLFGDIATYVDPNDVRAIRTSLDRALSLPRPGQNVRSRFVEDHSWSKVAEDLIREYEATLTEHS